MKVTLTTGPTIEPISRLTLGNHLLLSDSHPDMLNDVLPAMITETRWAVEDITNRKLLTQTWTAYLDSFPTDNFIKLPFWQLQSVTSIKYKDTDGDETTMTVGTDYYVETNGQDFGRLVLPYGESWPSTTLYPSNPITIIFICGWTTAALVPRPIVAAIKLMCADRYENRGEPVMGVSRTENPAAEHNLASWRLWGEF